MVTTYQPQGIHRRIVFTVTPDLIARFNAKVQRGEPDQCWPWTGAPRNGYGAIKHCGHVLGTHIVAYRIAKGDVPAGLLVTHSCDNRICCNPNHLSAGTHSDNMQEAFARRDVNVTRGEKSPNTTLTEDTVKLVLSLHRVYRLGYRRQSRLHGICEGSLDHIIRRTRWGHVVLTDDEAQRIAGEFARINFSNKEVCNA